MFHTSRTTTVFFITLLVHSRVVPGVRIKASKACRSGIGTLHDFPDEDINGTPLELRAFRDQIVLAVNVATFCQYTYQYIGLNKLLEKYGRGRAEGQRCGLTILGVPCNQFGHQEPGKNAYEILNGLEYVRPGYGFKPELVMLRKRDVNGGDEDGLYTWLKSSCPSPSPFINELKNIYYSPVHNDDVSWNFEKFLMDHKGRPRRRYTSAVEPEEIVGDIEELIISCQE